MKKIHMLIAGLLTILPTLVWAKGEPTFYAALETSVSSSGGGKVYADSTETENASKYGNTSNAKAAGSKKGSSSSSTSASVTLYAFAKANYGKVLSGWSTSDGGTVVSGSSANPFAVKISSSQQSSTSPETKKYYAVFVDNPNSYTLTLNNPDGLSSYTVTAPDGFPKDLSHGGSATVYKGDQYTFKYDIDTVGYNFVNWVVNGEEKTGNPVSVTISGNTTVVLNLAAKKQFVATCQAAVGGNYKATVGSTTKTVSSGVEELSNFGSIVVKFSDAVADEEHEFYGWYKLHPNGVKEYLSYYKASAETSEVFDNIVVGAEFRRKADLVLNFQPTEGVSYTVNGNTTVSDEAYEMTNYAAGKDGKEIALAITSEIVRQPKWWYKDSNQSEKTYFSYDKSVTKTFTASAIVGVDLVHSEKSLAKVLDSVESGTVALTSDAEVLDGTAVTIPAGVEVVVPEGKTLYVDGSLTVNGTLTVNGSVSKCLKLIKQSGEDGLRPVNPYGSVKYWKSAKAVSSTASVNNWSGTIGDHLTVMRGDGVAVRGAITSSTGLVKCTFDGNVAVNHVTAIGGALDNNSISSNESYILLNDVTINGPKSTASSDKNYDRIDCWATIDCAGWGCTMGTKQISSNSSCVMLNAATFAYSAAIGNYWQGGTVKFYNCPSISIKPIKGTPTFHLYDSGTSALTFTQNSSGTAKCQFYSGKFGTDLSGNGPSWINADGARIHGGCFQKQPNDKWIETETKKTHAFCQHADGYWYLDVKQDTSVAKIGSTPYDTIDEALHYLKENEVATITLLRDVTLEQAYALDKGKSLVMELNGCRINAPNGFVVNSGVLSIRDKDNRLSGSGITVGENANVVENLEDGKVDICYGAYTGNFVNSGTFTTHHGKFTGSITNNGGTMNLNGGVFSTDVSPLLNKGYHAFSYNGLHYVGRFPRPELGESSLGGFAHTLKAMPDVDATLYRTKKTYSLESCSNIEEWRHVAELKAAYSLFADDFNFDILGGFDRDIQADTVSAKVKVGGLSPSEGFPAMTAGEMDRLFTPRITQTKISYARFIYDNGEGIYDNLEAAVSDDGSNKGTTCTLAMDLWRWHDSKKKDYMVSYLTILKKTYVFGAGSNTAMLQTPAGAVPDENFFATLEAAVASDATTGKTIKLCNDCNEVLTVNKSCTIDPNGFEFSGTLTAGEGLSMKTKNGVYVFKAPDPADVYVEQVNVDTVVSDDWKTENSLSENATDEEIHEALKQEDTNGNAKWENLVMGQDGSKNAEIEGQAKGSATAAEIAVSFTPPEKTGYTVKYAFDKVDETVEGGVVKGTAQATPTLDIESVTAENGPAYFKMRAVLEASDKSGVTAEVPVEKTIGVMKVESDAEYTILAVPWVSLGDGAVKASELVHAASLQEEDELIVYGDDGKSFKKWTVKNGVWAKSKEAELPDEGELEMSETPDPGKVGLARGKGVWLKRSKPEESPIYLIGQPSNEAVETPLAVADDTEGSSWNLVASPSAEPVNVVSLLGGNGSDADRVVVPTGANSAPKNFHYRVRKNVGAWGYDSTEYVLNDGTTATVLTAENEGKVLGVRAVFVTEGDGTKVPAGTGFWYLNSSKTEGKKISWGGTDNNQAAE